MSDADSSSGRTPITIKQAEKIALNNLADAERRRDEAAEQDAGSSPASAEQEFEKCCPCFLRHSGDNTGTCEVVACKCYSLKIDRERMAFGWPGPQDKRPNCTWPGHVAHRRAVEAARAETWREAAVIIREHKICGGNKGSCERLWAEEFERRAGDSRT